MTRVCLCHGAGATCRGQPRHTRLAELRPFRPPPFPDSRWPRLCAPVLVFFGPSGLVELSTWAFRNFAVSSGLDQCPAGAPLRVAAAENSVPELSPSHGEGSSRIDDGARAGLPCDRPELRVAELGREEWARLWPEDIIVRDGVVHFW